MTKLILYDNQIGDEEAQALAKALHMNCTLTSLELSNNQLGTAGVQALNKAMATNYTMTELSLDKVNLIRNTTAVPYEVPTLMEIGIFAVGKGKSREEIEALPPLPAELNEKIMAHFFAN